MRNMDQGDKIVFELKRTIPLYSVDDLPWVIDIAIKCHSGDVPGIDVISFACPNLGIRRYLAHSLFLPFGSDEDAVRLAVDRVFRTQMTPGSIVHPEDLIGGVIYALLPLLGNFDRILDIACQRMKSDVAAFQQRDRNGE